MRTKEMVKEIDSACFMKMYPSSLGSANERRTVNICFSETLGLEILLFATLHVSLSYDYNQLISSSQSMRRGQYVMHNVSNSRNKNVMPTPRIALGTSRTSVLRSPR